MLTRVTRRHRIVFYARTALLSQFALISPYRVDDSTIYMLVVWCGDLANDVISVRYLREIAISLGGGAPCWLTRSGYVSKNWGNSWGPIALNWNSMCGALRHFPILSRRRHLYKRKAHGD